MQLLYIMGVERKSLRCNSNSAINSNPHNVVTSQPLLVAAIEWATCCMVLALPSSNTVGVERKGIQTLLNATMVFLTCAQPLVIHCIARSAEFTEIATNGVETDHMVWTGS